MGVFRNWFDEMVMTASKFGAPIANLDSRDNAGLKHMARPGFRNADRELITRNSPEVEKKLTKATEKYGVHWIVAYLEPPEDANEVDDLHWANYARNVKHQAADLLNQFKNKYDSNLSSLAPPDKNNTIVYIKPTSRVHSLSPHELIHNIGHAIWLRNPGQMRQAKVELQNAVKILQQAAAKPDPIAFVPQGQPPSEAEITIVLARLLDLLSYQRALILNPGDLGDSVKIAFTAFQNFDEVIFELFPAFINAGGQINLYPRGPGKIAKFDRAGPIAPNQEVIQKKGVRSWVWDKMAADRDAWTKVSKILTNIVIECLQASTWANKNGPIFPYQKLTTQP